MLRRCCQPAGSEGFILLLVFFLDFFMNGKRLKAQLNCLPVGLTASEPPKPDIRNQEATTTNSLTSVQVWKKVWVFYSTILSSLITDTTESIVVNALNERYTHIYIYICYLIVKLAVVSFNQFPFRISPLCWMHWVEWKEVPQWPLGFQPILNIKLFTLIHNVGSVKQMHYIERYCSDTLFNE